MRVEQLHARTHASQHRIPTGPRRVPTRRRLALAAAAAALVGVLTPVPGAQAIEYRGPAIGSPRFEQVGTVPIFHESSSSGIFDPTTNGWLIIDPGSRRGYTIAEGARPSLTNPARGERNTSLRTSIESFDLDTLQLLHRVEVPDLPIGVGYGASGTFESLSQAGDIVHAVDPVAHRIYLPLAVQPQYRSGDPDERRYSEYFLVIDEDAFDRDPQHAFGRFGYPVGQEHLATYNVMGMAISREHVGPDQPGKLLAQFSSALPSYTQSVHDHQLVQWDTSRVRTDEPPGQDDLVTSAASLATSDWAQSLPSCATASATSQSRNYEHTIQKGILARRDAVYAVCQSAPNSGAVVRVPLDPATGLVTAETQRFTSLGKPVGDVLVDEGAGRLYLKSFNPDDTSGTSWWVFDTTDMRFTGAVAAHPFGGRPMGAGVDPATGRLYTLTQDDCIPRAGGGFLPVRGGLQVTEAGLDPVPAPENVVPELAYPSYWRISVDPVRRRVFLRRGMHQDQTNYRFQYPTCHDSHATDNTAFVEYFWRVYEDRVPLPGEPRPLDDATLTTNSAESADRTEASFLGTGSGYGARSLLVGGLDAVTNGQVTQARSVCGRDDREALFGSVGSVEVADTGVSAEAAALDADAGTQGMLADPTSRCRPQSGNPQLDRCYGDVHEFAFDQAVPDGADKNGDGCTDRDGENRYAVKCLGASNAANPGFDDDEHKLPRDGFEAKASCDDEGQKATGSATGAMSSADQAVTVDESSSTVDVVRKANKGVVVKVDSVARGVTIKGQGTIGVVRNEVTSTSTGRDGGAFTSFTRTVCDVDVAGVVFRGCFGDEDTLQNRAKQINQAMGGYAELRLRAPDPTLARGTPHGYLAAVQRDAKQRFGDQQIAKDRSLAVPALEIVTNRGDGGPWGAGRQIYQLAGAQASTSYGIACTYGRSAKGGCAGAGEEALAPSDFSEGGGGTITNTVAEQVPGEPAAAVHRHESVVTRLLKAIPRALAQALRLLFNNPRELGLLAALWALLYTPCYLGDRRRAVRSVAARRLSTG